MIYIFLVILFLVIFNHNFLFFILGVVVLLLVNAKDNSKIINYQDLNIPLKYEPVK